MERHIVIQTGIVENLIQYYKFADGTWNDGDFGNETVNDHAVFICEWD